MVAVSERAELINLFNKFVQYLSNRTFYNEACIQHELGYFLRKEFEQCLTDYQVEFERNIKSIIKKKSASFIKKEIDLFISSNNYKYAIELKYVSKQNGRIPENMFDFCKDIKFLEQMKENGFNNCYFLAVVEKNSPFNSGICTDGIYKIFRKDKMICGCIKKPTGAKDKEVKISGNYKTKWQELNRNWEYLLIEV